MARAIQNGERESGVTVIRMTPRIDAGGMIAIARTPIDPDETAGELEAPPRARSGRRSSPRPSPHSKPAPIQILPQDKALVTKAPKLRKEDGLIDWSKPAQAVHNQVRAMQPWPVAYTYWSQAASPDAAPVRLIIHASTPVEGQGPPGTVLEAQGDQLVVAAGTGAVRVLTIQREGKKAGSAAEFLRGQSRRCRRPDGAGPLIAVSKDAISMVWSCDASTVSASSESVPLRGYSKCCHQCAWPSGSLAVAPGVLPRPASESRRGQGSPASYVPSSPLYSLLGK